MVAAAVDVPVLVKALALGAEAVGIGRPYAYWAALAGTDGIVHVLRSILAEADLLTAIDGVSHPGRPGTRRVTAGAMKIDISILGLG